MNIETNVENIADPVMFTKKIFSNIKNLILYFSNHKMLTSLIIKKYDSFIGTHCEYKMAIFNFCIF